MNDKVKFKKSRKFSYKNLSYPNKRVFWGIIFLLPWFTGALVFFLGPLVRTFYYSLFSITLASDGLQFAYTGLTNFNHAMTVNADFKPDLFAALLQVAGNVPIQIFMSLFIAILLNGKYKGRGLFRLVFFVPIILATGITKLDIRGAAIIEEEAQSVINTEAVVSTLSMSGIPTAAIDFVLDFVDSIFEVVTTAGVQLLIFLAGLQGISPVLYEVANIEGCTKFETFCKITLPMISPMILVCLVYSLADTFSRAEISKIIRDTTFSGGGGYGLGAAMSAIYFLVSLGVILVVSYIVSKVVFYYDK